MIPVTINVTNDRHLLKIKWPDGTKQYLDAMELRLMSRSAQTESAKIAGYLPAVDKNLKIETVNLVGNYAINIGFSDGYAKGIYPWKMLRDTPASAVSESQAS